MSIVIETNFEFNKPLERRDASKIKLIILHHRAGDGDVESIHEAHKRRGWAGIGYHFYIRKDGSVYRGRPTDFIGAHCGGCNTSTIGICLEGNFVDKDVPSEEQLDSLSAVIHEIKKEYPGIYRVLNHRDLCKTLCPGVDLKAMIKGVKKDGYFRKDYK